MGKDAIEFHRKRSVTIICTVDLSKSELDNLDDYTGTLTAKVYKDDAVAVIEKVGSIVGLVITFTLGSTETDKTENIHHYDIVVTKPPIAEEDPLIHTVIQDTLRILQSVSN